MNPETKNCQNCKNNFIIEEEDFVFYNRVKVPPPTFCPECRLVRRLARRNERTFYRRACEKCGKSEISVFAPESGIHVYCRPCWWGDSWDALDYGVPFDASRNFLIQLSELFHRVPLMSLYGLYSTLTNSDYTNMVSYLKNCYMVTYSDYGENLIYGSFVNYSKDSVDNMMAKQIELSYETINCNQCYRTFFSVDCLSCNDVWFSKNCVGCQDCFGCVNLNKKSYHIFNEPYTKEEYMEKMKDLHPASVAKIESSKQKAEELWKKYPQKYYHGIRAIASSGDYITDTKNVKDSFIGFNFEDSRFCSFVTGKMTDTYDFTNYGEDSSLMYEVCQAGGQSSNLKMGHWVINNCQNLEYCLFMDSCKDCFGCVGLKKHEYCIFNMQYTKEEYFALKKQIIEQMDINVYKDSFGLEYKYGEFFPIEISPFGYNETTAQEFFPLTKAQALEKGYGWRDPEKRNYQPTIIAKDLAETISETPETIVDDIIECAHKGACNDQCTQAFKIVPEELSFYRRMNLPVPHLCPNCRHAQRLHYRNPMKLWRRSCMKEGCTNEFETSYSPERKEIIYCEKCYQQEVV